MLDKNNFTDVSFLIASSSKKSYQKLSENYSAIEPPTWALLLAQSCRSIGYKVNILDANAENLSKNQILEKLNALNLRVLVFVVYGQNVNAGTANMKGAIDITNFLKENNIEFDNEMSEEVVGFGEVLPKGNYVLVNDILNKEDEEIAAAKGDLVMTFEDQSPVDTILGVDIFSVIHIASNEKIFVSLDDIKEE